MRRRINTAIIGYGKMGRIRHDAIVRSGHNVVGIYDINSSDIDKNLYVENTQSVFDNKKIECVFICTPNCFNKDLTIQSMLSGKHVFCEKPPALNAQELKDVIKYEKQTNQKLMYGFNHRHHDSIKYMKDIIDSKRFGRILWMRGRYGKNINRDFFTTWRADKKMSGGGILLDQGIHLLDLFIYFSDGFDNVKSFVSNDFWKIDGIEDNAFVILKNQRNKITASLHSTMTQWRHLFSFEVFLEHGWMVLNGLKTPSGNYGNEVLSIAENKSNISNEDTPCERHEYNIDSSWKQEVSYFFNCILSNNKIEKSNSRDALNTMSVIEKIYMEWENE